MTQYVAAFGALWGLSVLACWLATGGRQRRMLAIATAALGLPIPYLVSDPPPIVGFLLAVIAFFTLLRIGELTNCQEMSFWRRAWHIAGVVDTRFTRRVSPSFDMRRVARIAIHAAVTAAGAYVVFFVADDLQGMTRDVVRFAAGLVVGYAFFEVSLSNVALGYSMLGIQHQVMHRDPVLSKSVTEFWGQRWNMVVGRYLRRNVYLPIARRRKRYSEWLGLAATFGASAAIHFYLAVPAVGWVWASWVAAFFVAQVPLIAVERLLGVRRWPAPAAHLWTLAVMIGTAPLFILPFLVVLGV